MALTKADMAEYLFKKDLDTNAAGIQNVTTHTVGFTVDLPLLAETARRGGGQYFLADDTSSLAAALNDIVVSILDDAATYTAPTVPVTSRLPSHTIDEQPRSRTGRGSSWRRREPAASC